MRCFLFFVAGLISVAGHSYASDEPRARPSSKTFPTLEWLFGQAVYLDAKTQSWWVTNLRTKEKAPLVFAEKGRDLIAQCKRGTYLAIADESEFKSHGKDDSFKVIDCNFWDTYNSSPAPEVIKSRIVGASIVLLIARTGPRIIRDSGTRSTGPKSGKFPGGDETDDPGPSSRSKPKEGASE